MWEKSYQVVHRRKNFNNKKQDQAHTFTELLIFCEVWWTQTTTESLVLQTWAYVKSRNGGAWWAAVHGVAKSRTRLNNFPFTFHFHALEKEMTTHCSFLAWRIPGTGEPGGLPSMGSHRVGHYWSDLAAAAAAAAFSLVLSEAINVHFKHNFISLQREKQTKKKKSEASKFSNNVEQVQCFLFLTSNVITFTENPSIKRSLPSPQRSHWSQVMFLV